MAVINTTLLSLTNSVVQPLYIIDFPQTGVPRVVSTGSSVTVALDTASVSTGTAASVNLTTDVVTLQPMSHSCWQPMHSIQVQHPQYIK